MNRVDVWVREPWVDQVREHLLEQGDFYWITETVMDYDTNQIIYGFMLTPPDLSPQLVRSAFGLVMRFPGVELDNRLSDVL